MPVDTPLDFTPRFTMSTIQTSNEIANIIINSLLIAFILSNIKSTVSKVMHFTRNSSFSYNSWLRAFIFASSDDPLRLLSWVLRKNVYRDKNWTRYPNRLRLGRLILPLLARFVVLIVSMTAIAITIPQDKILDGCAHGDYRIDIVKEDADPNLPIVSLCSEIPVESNLGVPNATAAFCVCPIPISGVAIPSGPDIIAVASTGYFKGLETMFIILNYGGRAKASLFYIEWKRGDIPQKSFRSELGSHIPEKDLSALVFSWFLEDHPDCEAIEDDDPNDAMLAATCLDDDDVDLIMNRTMSRVKSSLRLVPTDAIQPRIALDNTGDGNIAEFTDCIAPVIVTRPIVNMVPLAIMLIVWILVNSAISKIVSQHDDALDAGFHIVKEALGHDTTSNPLEMCTEREEIMKLPLRKWRCVDGGGHVGFIGRGGDVEVMEFDKTMVVGGCAVVGAELERARVLQTAPRGFISPNRNPQQEH